MKKTLKRSASLLFVVALLFSLLTVPASAYTTYATLPIIWRDSNTGAYSSSGYYTIIPATNKDKALDLWGNVSEDGTNIQIYASNWTDAQIFTIEYVRDGWYKIVHTASGKVLDVEGVNPASGTNVFLWWYHGGDNQLWKFIREGDGYRIQSKLGTYLDASYSGNVWAYEGNKDSGSQLWYLMDASTNNARRVNNVDGDLWPASNYYSMTQKDGATVTIQFRGKNHSVIKCSAQLGADKFVFLDSTAPGLRLSFIEDSKSLTDSAFHTGSIKLKMEADRSAIGQYYTVAISLGNSSSSLWPVYTFNLYVYE